MTASGSAGSVGWRIGTAGLGGLLGGLIGGFFVVGMTLVLKAGMDRVAALDTWLLIGVPLVGLALAVLVLQGYGRDALPGAERSRRPSRMHSWRAFRPGAIRADITGDIVECAGEEERFPWRLAPIRAVAILATVGSGGAMGTEAPAAYLGDAAGVCLGDRGRQWRRLLRPAALGGGAAGVAALMGVALVGTAYLLELGQRRRNLLSAERLTAALVGGLVGWGINVAFNLNLIRLIVPKEPPRSFAQAAITALFIGSISGAITSVTGTAIYRAKKWRASPGVRLALGGLAALATALALATIAPATAVGPGGGAILWAENTQAPPMTLLAVCLLRAAATTAAAAAGGCGGVFVPFLAIGDIGGRVFVPELGIGSDLAGAAGAAAGIAGGYRLPLTAIAMVVGIGGPRLATLTCLATVGIAFVTGASVEMALDRASKLWPLGQQAEAP